MAIFTYHRASDRITAGTWSLSTGTARAGYLPAAVADSDPSAPCWITGTSIRLVNSFGSPIQVDHVYIFAHDFVNSADVRVQMHTSSSWATPDVNVALTVPTAYEDGFAYHLHADVAAAYPTPANRTKAFLSIANLVANAATVYIGEIWIVGSVRTFSRSLNWNVVHPRQRLTSRSTSKRGVSTVYDYGSIERHLRGTFHPSPTDYTDLRALEADARGDALPFVVVLDAANTNPLYSEPLYVRLAKTITDTPPIAYRHAFAAQLDLEELGRGELLGA